MARESKIDSSSNFIFHLAQRFFSFECYSFPCFVILRLKLSVWNYHHNYWLFKINIGSLIDLQNYLLKRTSTWNLRCTKIVLNCLTTTYHGYCWPCSHRVSQNSLKEFSAIDTSVQRLLPTFDLMKEVCRGKKTTGLTRENLMEWKWWNVVAFRFSHINSNFLISRRCLTGDVKRRCQNENAHVWGVLRAACQ